MRRLLNMADWPWTDYSPTASRYFLFLRSGEALTTIFLASYAWILISSLDTFNTSPAFRWLSSVSNGNELPWGVAAFALSITGPLALALDRGTLRVLSVVSQGIFFLMFGISFQRNSPAGLGWVTFIICGLWLLCRAVMLVQHHWKRGGGR